MARSGFGRSFVVILLLLIFVYSDRCKGQEQENFDEAYVPFILEGRYKGMPGGIASIETMKKRIVQRGKLVSEDKKAGYLRYSMVLSGVEYDIDLLEEEVSVSPVVKGNPFNRGRPLLMCSSFPSRGMNWWILLRPANLAPEDDCWFSMSAGIDYEMTEDRAVPDLAEPFPDGGIIYQWGCNRNGLPRGRHLEIMDKAGNVFVISKDRKLLPAKDDCWACDSSKIPKEFDFDTEIFRFLSASQ